MPLKSFKLWGLPWPVFLLVAFLAALLGFGLFQTSRPAPAVDLAAYTLTTPSDETLRLDALGGQPLLINFWATWCPPCIEELPVLSQFAQSSKNAGVRVIGVALDEPQAVQNFLHQYPLPYPVLIEKNGAGEALATAVGNTEGALPYSVLLSATGQILATQRGGFTADSLDRFVQPLQR